MAKQRGIGPIFPDTEQSWREMVDHFDLLDKAPEGTDEDPEAVRKLIVASRKVLQRSIANMDVIDFDDMVYMPLVLNLRMLKHDWVLIDEAQDTNPTRRALAERLLAPAGDWWPWATPIRRSTGFRARTMTASTRSPSGSTPR
jgi:DNA helicase-2/ATP-dependent DNA helicase PcrA